MTVATSNLSVEHVLPRKWSENWPLKNGSHVEFESVWEASSVAVEMDDETKTQMQERQRVVNTLGNLTLITEALNPSLSNAAWESTDKKLGKQERLGESLLALNREIAKVQLWNEDAIKNRAALLATRINTIWPSTHNHTLSRIEEAV